MPDIVLVRKVFPREQHAQKKADGGSKKALKTLASERGMRLTKAERARHDREFEEFAAEFEEEEEEEEEEDVEEAELELDGEDDDEGFDDRADELQYIEGEDADDAATSAMQSLAISSSSP
ncbi:hypothetical protein PINS_up004858 [Pythium insidiosum]|nr:hypothetical protein PINS_up004858 [Pythium insidiosum]